MREDGLRLRQLLTTNSTFIPSDDCPLESTRQAEQMPPIGAKIPAVSRDPKDDYLPTYALVAKADYLVTGDKDLLVLKQVGQVKILSPKDFVARLQLQSRGEA